MLEVDNESLKQPQKIKYRPSKKGKIALGIAIGSLSVGLLTFILSALSIISGYVVIMASTVACIIPMIATMFLMVDRMRFNKSNNVNENSDSKMVIGLVIGIVIGFMWGKLL